MDVCHVHLLKLFSFKYPKCIHSGMLHQMISNEENPRNSTSSSNFVHSFNFILIYLHYYSSLTGQGTYSSSI